MDKKDNLEKWSTLKEIQEYLGIGRETVLQWIANATCQPTRWADCGS